MEDCVNIIYMTVKVSSKTITSNSYQWDLFDQ